MKNIRKVLVIVILAAVLGLTLYFRHFIFDKSKGPSLIERLPNADFVAVMNTLEMSKELDILFSKNKLAIREFTASDFILSQGKNSGLDVQRSVYLFANVDANDWGCVIHVTDSSKIIDAIDRFRKNTKVKDESIRGVRIFKFEDEDLSVAYQNNYLLIYSGPNLSKCLYLLSHSTSGKVRSDWKKVLKPKIYQKENLIIYSRWKGFKEYGIDHAYFSHDNDSAKMCLKYHLISGRGFPVAARDSGLGFEPTNQEDNSIELHLNPSLLRSKNKMVLREKLIDISRKINFPMASFLSAWEGDLSFRQGGLVKSSEKYIVTEFDDNFNPQEVHKQRDTLIPGFSVAFNYNTNGSRFINDLFAKGLLHKEDKKYRFLFSPLLSIIQTNNYYIFTASALTPKLEKCRDNRIKWTKDGTSYTAKLSKIEGNIAEGTVEFTLKKLMAWIKIKSKKKR